MKLSAILLPVAVIILLGAGCTGTTPSDTTTKPATNNETQPPSNNTDETTSPTASLPPAPENGIEATAEPLGEGTVRVAFGVAEELQQKDNTYRLILDREANPEFPGINWYELWAPHQEKVWTNLPSGEYHIRVCLVENDICSVYSNDVAVTIE